MRHVLAAAIALCPMTALAQAPYVVDVREKMQEAVAFFEDSGLVLESTGEEILKEDEEFVADFQTVEGRTYVVAAVCDTDCTDMDIFVQSEDGTLIGADEETDARPIVILQSDYSGEHTLVARMVDCDTADCYVGIMVLSQ